MTKSGSGAKKAERLKRDEGVAMTLFFANPEVDTEDVRETVEDNLGEEIMQIDTKPFFHDETDEAVVGGAIHKYFLNPKKKK
jgi:hypothetical protein